MSNVKTWAGQVGFKDLGSNAYRGYIHTDNLESVQKALTEMGLTSAHSKPGFEIWSSENDKEVVLINYSGQPSNTELGSMLNPIIAEGTQNLKPELQKLVDKGFKLFVSAANEHAEEYPDALPVWQAAALAADGFVIYADKPTEMWRIARLKEMWRIARLKDQLPEGGWKFKIYKMENN